MTKNFSREIKAAERTIAVQDKPKDRDMFKNKNKRKLPVKIQPYEKSYDFIKDLKAQLTYGDTGHGVLLDEKV